MNFKEIERRVLKGVATLGIIVVGGYGAQAVWEAFTRPTPVIRAADGLPTPTATLVPRAESKVTPSVTVGPEVIATAVPTIDVAVPVNNYWETAYSNAAKKDGESWILHNPDGAEVKVNLAGAIGFTPDADLKVSDIAPKDLGNVPADAGDFQAYLNKPREGFGPLAGFTDGTNDYNQYYNQESGPQVPVYSWMVHTGLDVELPGIGRVTGGPGRAAMVLIINRTERVYRFTPNSAKVVAGFQGWGRIWDGSSNTVQEAEKRLDNHYRTRLGQGVPETGFIGQCDQASKNCNDVTIVAVERVQWGNNSDGTPRDQFRLIRAETIAAAK